MFDSTVCGWGNLWSLVCYDCYKILHEFEEREELQSSTVF